MATTKNLSPLEQARRSRQVNLKSTADPLSDADQAKLQEILEDYDHVHHVKFEEEDAYKQIFEECVEIPEPDTSWYHPVMDDLSNGKKKNDGSVVLTREEEQALFLKFNYCRYRVVQLRDELKDATEIDPDVARECLKWFRKAEMLKEQIAGTNLALVLAMAKRSRQKRVDFSEMISEGNMALLRAVDKFDASKGFKFSTYACRAIIKSFSRLGVKHSRYKLLFPTGYDPKMEKSDFTEQQRAEHREECIDEVRLMLTSNRAELSEVERCVIDHRFGVGERAPEEGEEAEALTLEEVGKIVGVTKERVRQIQNQALKKLRQTLDDTYLT
ncbi:MAG: sigma-70 family RNA polymerase sigma factor [Phycisphaeraceae bacterium]|nr:sigma-70 family RNA polymerase sigma factor [Phycisphaeraceae bacterium]